MKRSWRAMAITAAAALVGSGLALAGPATSASAANPGSCYAFQFSSSQMRMQPLGNSGNTGTPIVQEWANDTPIQTWCVTALPQIGTGVFILWNEQTQLCLYTDGVAGHTLTQQPCGYNPGEYWVELEHPGFNLNEVWTLWNTASGHAIDVYGDSYSAGGAIDDWYNSIGYEGEGYYAQRNQSVYEIQES